MTRPASRPRIAPVDDPDAEQAELLSKTLLTEDGRPLNVFAKLARNPRLLKRFNVLGGFFLRHGGITSPERALADLRGGAPTGSEYEFAQRLLIGAEAGLSAEE